ncbi:unknown [Crocosphaera subtropica ATCC 51142]|uniref:Uncharacterized protein n=1 Tax=Crocosphaera subtropica (strain ATCC 51142 / BH68) TaxID=43989 RepID=B1WNX1_CROS5|nr:hypothetical protein [Crocosphaera subtropica]ACB53150.1 unknown [Crocosphaera subtropica ATCC 51142]
MEERKALTPTSIEGIFTITPEETIPPEVMDKAIIGKYFLEKALGKEVNVNLTYGEVKMVGGDRSAWWFDIVSYKHYLISQKGKIPTEHKFKYLNAGYSGVSVNTIYRRGMNGKTIVGTIETEEE